MNFRTRVDLTNRQAKQYEKTNINLSGGTVFGLPYSALTSGIDTNSSGISETYTSILSTFSGNTGTTNYSWYDSRMSLGESELSALTSSNSGVSQDTNFVFVVSSSTTIDNNVVNLSYSGVSFDITVNAILDLGGGNYSGSVITNELNILSANTLDFTGRTIWVDVSGITRTDRLIVTDTPTIGYVLKCVDSEGMVAWAPDSSGTTGSTSYWSAGTGTNAIVKIDSGCLASAIGSVVGATNSTSDGQYSAIIGGFGHSITAGSDVSSIFGGAEHTINSAVDYSICIGGRGNTVSTSYSGIFVGQNNTLSGGTDLWSAIIGGDNNILKASRSLVLGGTANILTASNSAIIGGSGNTMSSSATNSIILGGQNISATTNDMVYVPDLIIDGLISTDPLATDSNGKIVAGASDIRLKTNIQVLESALDKIKNLRGVSYEWTEESGMGAGVKKYGLIAQEVQQIIPDMVRERSKGDGMLSLSYTEIVPWLIEAIKELTSGITLSNKHITLETQTIASEDNNIELNYGGNKDTAIGGGITVLHAITDGVHSEIKTDENGNWIISPPLITKQYTPKSTNDEFGKIGDTVWDDDYTYIKTNNGWKRTSLENF
jgi:hypothetical protein